MAVVGSFDIPEEFLRLFNNLVRRVDTRRHGAVAQQGHLLSRQKKLNVSNRSLLPQISEQWATLDTTQKNAWKSAGSANNLNGWNLFVQDTAYRIKYGLSGLATPSDLHQYKCGKIEIASPASSAKLVQYHPNRYWKLQKVAGSKALYTDIAINEKLVLPLDIGLSYKSNFIEQSDDAYVRFYAIITSHYQGRDIETVSGFDIPFSTDWARQTIECSEVLGLARSYELWLDFFDVRGEFYWDNLRSYHTGTNWARDYRCNDVNNNLSKINYQIEKSWEEQLLPSGSAFDSVYPD